MRPRIVAFDTETKGFGWWTPDEQAFLGSWAYRTLEGELVSGTSYIAEPGDDRDRMTSLLARSDVLVGVNTPFDIHQYRETCGVNLRTHGAELHDVGILSRLLEPETTHGLKDIATRLVDPEAKVWEEKVHERMKELKIKKHAPKAYYDVWRAYPEDLENYARMDAVYTLRAWEILHPRLAEVPKIAEVYELERQVEPVISEAERFGVRIDQEAVTGLRSEYEPRAQELRESLVATLGDVLEGEGSRDGLRQALLDHGVPLHKRTEKEGILRTDKMALAEFEDDFPVLQDLSEWRRVSKFVTTYLDPMSEADPDLHTNFLQCEARTGRMSSRRPNMQNLPKAAGKEVRSPIVPRPDQYFVVLDYEGIEARLLAYYLGDEGYKQLFRDGHDPHAWMASKIHGGSPDEYAKGSAREDLRSRAKNTMFAITYGAGGPRVANMNKISLEASRSLISTIKQSLPGYYKLMRRIKKKVGSLGYVETIMGRRQYVPRDKGYVGLNALIQGSAADIMKRGAVATQAAIAPHGRILLFIHDEVVIETPDPERVEPLASAALAGAWDLDPPLTVDSTVVSTNYADA